MVNPQFMKSLAMLESVAATQSERDTINHVRGRYVSQFGTNNTFVRSLAKLESVANTTAELNEINTIRGVYGLMSMTDLE